MRSWEKPPPSPSTSASISSAAMEHLENARSVRLKCHLGTYLCAVDDNSGEVICHGTIWAVELAGDNYVHLQDSRGSTSGHRSPRRPVGGDDNNSFNSISPVVNQESRYYLVLEEQEHGSKPHIRRIYNGVSLIMRSHQIHHLMKDALAQLGRHQVCGGTEIGGGFIAESVLQPQALSAFGTPAMGCNLFILDSSGNPLPHDSVGIGELALDPTLFGSSTTMLNVDHHEAYFSGMPEWNGKALWGHGDDLSVLQKDIIGLMGMQMTQ